MSQSCFFWYFGYSFCLHYCWILYFRKIWTYIINIIKFIINLGLPSSIESSFVVPVFILISVIVINLRSLSIELRSSRVLARPSYVISPLQIALSHLVVVSFKVIPSIILISILAVISSLHSWLQVSEVSSLPQAFRIGTSSIFPGSISPLSTTLVLPMIYINLKIK